MLSLILSKIVVIILRASSSVRAGARPSAELDLEGLNVQYAKAPNAATVETIKVVRLLGVGRDDKPPSIATTQYQIGRGRYLMKYDRW